MIDGLPPPDARVLFASTFLSTVVTESRFQPMLKVGSLDALNTFHQQIADRFPKVDQEAGIIFGATVEAANTLDVQPAEVSTTNAWTFKSVDDWTLRLTLGSLALETANYVDYEDFLQRYVPALDAFRASFGEPTLTRLGVRKINLIPEELIAPSDALQPVFVPLHNSPLGGALADVRTQLLLNADPGFVRVTFGTERVGETRRFRLDIDRYVQSEKIALDGLTELLTGLSDDSTALFRWSISDKLNELMQPEEK